MSRSVFLPKSFFLDQEGEFQIRIAAAFTDPGAAPIDRDRTTEYQIDFVNFVQINRSPVLRRAFNRGGGVGRALQLGWIQFNKRLLVAQPRHRYIDDFAVG